MGVGETKVFDTNLIYTRVIDYRSVPVKQILIESWHTPTRMLSDTGDVKICTAEPVLKKVIQSTVSTRHLETQISWNV